MIEPPKLAVFLVVVTAHLAVLAFGLPYLSPAPKASASQSASPSSPASLAAVERSPQPAGTAIGSDTHNQYGANRDRDHDHDHGEGPHSSAVPASANSSATRAGGRSPSDSNGPVDTVPTLEEHRRQHQHDDHDGEPQLVDLERIAHHKTKQNPAENQQVEKSKSAASLKPIPSPSQLAVAPKAPALKPLPIAGDESKASVPERPTPVQMIIPEKPVAKPPVAKPTLKPVAKPKASAKMDEPPRARPVDNAPKPVAPTSNRAGSSRMKNLRPIKKP